MLNLDDIINITKESREYVLKHLKDNNLDNIVEMGASGTPTRVIDKIAESQILENIKNKGAYPNILSEECGYIKGNEDYYVIIDPIDGTTNSLLDIPYYSISIAIGKRDLSTIQMGVVMNVITGDIYYAKNGEGAFFNGKQIHTRKFSEKGSVGYIYYGKRSPTEFVDLLNKIEKVRTLGSSSLDVCAIARGKGDVFYFNLQNYTYNIRVIDIAAASLVLKEAGGELYDLKGNILNMPYSLDYHAAVLALGDPSLMIGG